MKRIIIVVAALALAVIVWRISGRISSDALALAIGVVFGAMAGIPIAALVLVHERRQQPQMPQPQMPQPPTYNVLVVDGETVPNYIDAEDQ